MLFHSRQAQGGVLSDLLVASPFTGKLCDFPFAPCEPGNAWQPEQPESSGPFAVPAKILARD
jgi:hypothetical protein